MGKTLDIEFECQGINIDPRGNKVKVKAEYVDGIDFDTAEIAENIGARTFIEAYGIDSLLDYIYDEYKLDLTNFINENFEDE